MAFSGRVGVSLEIPESFSITSFLLNEEIGVVIQIEKNKLKAITEILKSQKYPSGSFLSYWRSER